jgi:hypothetical protein
MSRLFQVRSSACRHSATLVIIPAGLGRRARGAGQGRAGAGSPRTTRVNGGQLAMARRNPRRIGFQLQAPGHLRRAVFGPELPPIPNPQPVKEA